MRSIQFDSRMSESLRVFCTVPTKIKDELDIVYAVLAGPFSLTELRRDLNNEIC